jgi:hypothetical protein
MAANATICHGKGIEHSDMISATDAPGITQTATSAKVIPSKSNAPTMTDAHTYVIIS